MTRAASLAVLLAAGSAAAQSVALRGGGREVVVAVSSLEAVTVEVRDPTDGNKRKTLRGGRLREALAKLAPPDGVDAVAVRCDDGWLSIVPLAAVKKFPDAVLALGLPPPRGAVFLAWPNVAQPAVDADRDLTPNGWTFGVASLEYVRAADFEKPLALPAGATEAARRGRALFQRHCQHCHAVNGAGGMAGWDLNQPNLFTYRDEAYVRDYVIDPRKRNPDGHMAPFKGKLTAAEVGAVVAFLRAIKN
jgi:mono/diheme cytochrome c family protein